LDGISRAKEHLIEVLILGKIIVVWSYV